MLAHTHGQPASPTTLGKEVQVFVARLWAQVQVLAALPIPAKFGGATGNLNAHFAAYPGLDWEGFATHLVEERLPKWKGPAPADDAYEPAGPLVRSHPTTQIEHYDGLAALFDACRRVNVILIDLCRDVWSYISMGYFRQRIVAGEVGSSAMPHKVNPIDFENAEGNLGLANAIFDHLSNKLPTSRLQRDLTDSTVLRNLGVPFGHTLVALGSLTKGLGKLEVDAQTLHNALEANWAVVAEGIQTILRREAYPDPYNALKALTRTGKPVDAAVLAEFVEGLAVPEGVKAELRALSPHTYTGNAAQQVPPRA
jgi:adenylosuccinate lyase